MKHLYPLTLLLCLLFTSCASVPKLLDQRKFDKAYTVAHRRLRYRAGPTIIRQYLQAYEAIQASELAVTEALAQTTGTAKYAELYERYRGLYHRSVHLLELVPEEAKFDRYPALSPANLEAQRENARRQAGAHFLGLIAGLKPAALAGEKPAARRAWELHQRVAYFLPERDRELAAERETLRDIGTLRILLYAPAGEGDRELDESLARLTPLHRGWTSIIPRATELRVDLDAELLFVDYQDSGLRESCTTTEHEEEVLERIERKKVEKRINDSTVVEEIVEIKHYAKVYAAVTECNQSARVDARGELNVYQHGKNELLWRAPLSGYDGWSNRYRYATGDERAMPPFANSGRPSGPPSLANMLADAIAVLPHTARRRLVRRYGE